MSTKDPIPVGLCQCGCGERTKLADHTSTAKGLVKDQPLRYISNHHSRPVGVPQYEERDCGYKTPCWVWLWMRDANGYGKLKKPGKKRAYSTAHRVIWERRNGPVADGQELDHLCRNRACVNPDHLEVVTHAENVRRGAVAKLTPEAVAIIRAATPRVVTAKALGARFGVSEHTINGVRYGKTWRGVG